MPRSRSLFAAVLCTCALFCAAATAQPPTTASPTLTVPLLAGKSTRVGSVQVRVEGADLVVDDFQRHMITGQVMYEHHHQPPRLPRLTSDEQL